MYGVTIKVAPLKSSGSTGIAQHGDATATGYYQQKWLDPSIDPQSAGWEMGKDWVTIRYAEVLLTYAEAKNEVSPLDDLAFEAVNQIRRRVGMPELQRQMQPSRLTVLLKMIFVSVYVMNGALSLLLKEESVNGIFAVGASLKMY